MIDKRKKEKERVASVAVTLGPKEVFSFVARGFDVPVTVRTVGSGMPTTFGVCLRSVQVARAVLWVEVLDLKLLGCEYGQKHCFPELLAKLVFDFHCLRPFALEKKLPEGSTTVTAQVVIVWREGEWRAELLVEKALHGEETILPERPVLLGDVVGQPYAW